MFAESLLHVAPQAEAREKGRGVGVEKRSREHGASEERTDHPPTAHSMLCAVCHKDNS